MSKNRFLAIFLLTACVPVGVLAVGAWACGIPGVLAKNNTEVLVVGVVLVGVPPIVYILTLSESSHGTTPTSAPTISIREVNTNTLAVVHSHFVDNESASLGQNIEGQTIR